MGKLQDLIDFYPDEEFLSADGLEDAIIGVYYDRQDSINRLVYSRTKCIEIFINRDGMTHEEALEFFDYNVEGAYVGKQTPIWVDDEMFQSIDLHEDTNILNEGLDGE